MKVREFTGDIDGTGVKMVMVQPKSPIELIDPHFIEGVASVLQHGAKKYALEQWRNGMSIKTVLGGILRHTWAILRGEEIDPVENGGSGLPHVYHIGCGAMFLATFLHGPRNAEYRQFDDRVYKP